MSESVTFEKVYSINVNDKTEKKEGLTYLSWAWAWAEFKKIYPDANYAIKRFENNLPYVYDEKTGYMVFTEVTADGITHEMWLPVMNGANKAMKSNPYTYVVGKRDNQFEKMVEAATMTDINKTIMRCLTKNLAMFGLGLYIYAGEDLPESGDSDEDEQIATPELIEKFKILGGNITKLAETLNKPADRLTCAELQWAIDKKKKRATKQ